MNHKRSEIRQQLKILLSSEPEENILDYIISISSEEDFVEFMENIVEHQNDSHLNAKRRIQQILFPIKKNAGTPSNSSNKPTNSFKNEYVNEKQLTNKNRQSVKGKKKFQSINKYEKKEKIKEGRVACNCQGQKHDFMNNCLNCGRIHCIDEGPGPCLFCGKFLDASGRNDTLPDTFTPKENVIYDDDNDYFKVNHSSEAKSKKKMVIALDLATRKVIESTDEDEKLRKKILDDCKKHLKNVEQIYKNLQSSYSMEMSENIYDEMVDLLIRMRHIKLSGKEPDLKNEDSKMPDSSFQSKLVFDNVDQGLCLSMHQPYASLLIAGVKKHEGRNWPTNHKGILWIAAAAHKPETEEINKIEEFYRNYYNEPKLKFPSSYPTSCLLGYVEVDECLHKEAYDLNYPNGESDSPYVLICNNPTILPIFYPIVGQHKIYSLDKDLHKCAKMCMRYVNLGA